MHVQGGTVCDRSNSYLNVRIALFFFLIVSCFVPAFPGGDPAEIAVIKVMTEAAAKDVAARFGLTVIDSIPELSKYLVKGDAVNMGNARKAPEVLSVESDLVTQVTETAMLNESTVALLDPSTVALLDQQDKEWDGQHPVRSSLLHQAGLQRISFFQQDVLIGDPSIVAVIDTGVDPLHEMLIRSTLPGKNFIDERRSTDELLDLEPATAALLLQAGGRATLNNSVVAVLNPSTVALLDSSLVTLMNRMPSPYFGHGTLVSGLIHALAPNSLIMPLKVFDATGRGTSFRIAKAIVYAAANGADVINMSFRLDTTSPLVGDAIDYAARQNLVFVASIGNNNSKVDKTYPASYSKVIGVAATDLNDRKADFSNFGPAADVAAPGVALISAYPGGLYAVWSGTSAAAGLVSGEAALILSRKDLKTDDVIKRIQGRVDPLHDNYDLGKGRINLKSALKKL